MVSMLASGTRVRGFKPGLSRRIFSGEKILSLPFFGREVKPHVADLRHIKEPSDYMEVGSQAISRLIFPPFATRSARVDGDAEVSGGESGNV
jgi:hypothetical protein